MTRADRNDTRSNVSIIPGDGRCGVHSPRTHKEVKHAMFSCINNFPHVGHIFKKDPAAAPGHFH